MEVITQKLDDIPESLQPLTVDWRDDTARRVIDHLKSLRPSYSADDVKKLLDENFDDGMLICRLFLGLSKDQFVSALRGVRGEAGIGVQSYRNDPDAFAGDLLSMGLPEAMSAQVNRKPHWTDVLVERLRTGRRSAISGQRRGRGVEDFAEAVVRRVFAEKFQPRCTFMGPRGHEAKCDFAIPSKAAARILIESKGYAATGSKMTDILGDLRTIVAAKRADTALLFFTDGLTWKRRRSDLRKIVELQNNGDITRIYTYAMPAQFEQELRQLKTEFNL